MKPKKIAVLYDCGTDEKSGLEKRISICYDSHIIAGVDEGKFISAFTLKPNGETASIVQLELTDEVVKEISEILSKQ